MHPFSRDIDTNKRSFTAAWLILANREKKNYCLPMGSKALQLKE